MKILVASDIHGSSYYTSKLANIFNHKNCEQMVLLGDIYNHGPRNPFPRDYAPMKVAEILNGLKDRLLVIKGNCDSEVEQMISEFSFVNLGQMVVNNKTITFTHGHIFNKDNLPANAGDCLMYGHFHTGFIQKYDNCCVVNPGSIALPKDDIHSYIIIDNGEIQLWDIEKEEIIKREEL